MQFTVKTASPDTVAVETAKQDNLKHLLFQAVALYVKDNEQAKQDLLDLLAAPDKGAGEAPDGDSPDEMEPPA